MPLSRSDSVADSGAINVRSGSKLSIGEEASRSVGGLVRSPLNRLLLERPEDKMGPFTNESVCPLRTSRIWGNEFDVCCQKTTYPKLFTDNRRCHNSTYEFLRPRDECIDFNEFGENTDRCRPRCRSQFRLVKMPVTAVPQIDLDPGRFSSGIMNSPRTHMFHV